MEDEQIIDEQIEKKYKMKKELEELKGKIATNEGEKVRFKTETKNWLGFSEPFLAKEKSNLNISRYTLMAIIDEMLDKIKKDLDDLTKKRAELRRKERKEEWRLRN